MSSVLDVQVAVSWIVSGGVEQAGLRSLPQGSSFVPVELALLAS